MPNPRPRDSYYKPPRHTPGLSADFNPKAYTMAAQNPPRRKTLPTGPFIDSITDNYTGGLPLEQHLKRQAEIQLSRRSVRVLKASRVLVLMSRILQVLIGVALVVLLIGFKGIDNIEAWIMRISPGVAALHALYSVYHYARSAGERTPTSSAAYALFAAAIDCCVLPFYVFIGLWSFQEHLSMVNSPSSTNLWVTSFGDSGPDISELLVFLTFILACSGGGLTLFVLFLGIYIAVTFRRISRLPPDLNPLDKSFYTSMKAKSDPNRFSKASTTSTSTVDSLLTKPQRSVPFLETRTKNGSLQWEYSRPTEQQEEQVPTPFKFGEFERRNSVDFADGDLGSARTSIRGNDENKENVYEPMRETKRASTQRFAVELGMKPEKNGGYMPARQSEETAAWWGKEAENQIQREQRRQSTQSHHTHQSPRNSTQTVNRPNRNTFGSLPPTHSSRNSVYSNTTASTSPSQRTNNSFNHSPIRNSNGPQFRVPQISASRHVANSSRGSVYSTYETPLTSPTRMSQPSPNRGPIQPNQLNFDTDRSLYPNAETDRPLYGRRNTASSIANSSHDLPLPNRIPIDRSTPPTGPLRGQGQEQPLLSPSTNNSNHNPLNSYNPSAPSRAASPPPPPTPPQKLATPQKPTLGATALQLTPQKMTSLQQKPASVTPQKPSTPQQQKLPALTTTPKSVRAIIENANRFAKQQTSASPPLLKLTPKKKRYGDVELAASGSRKKKEGRGGAKEKEGGTRVTSTGTDAKLELKGLGSRFRNVSGSQLV